MAWNDPQARRGLRTGFVPRGWAQREHALWAASAVPAEAPGTTEPGTDAPEPEAGTLL
jgi:formate dehydrogenase subunit gamma